MGTIPYQYMVKVVDAETQRVVYDAELRNYPYSLAGSGSIMKIISRDRTEESVYDPHTREHVLCRKWPNEKAVLCALRHINRVGSLECLQCTLGFTPYLPQWLCQKVQNPTLSG